MARALWMTLACTGTACAALLAACGSSHTGSDGGGEAGRTDAAGPTDSGRSSDAGPDDADATPPGDAGSDGWAGCDDCDDGNPCTVGRCRDDGCVYEPDDGAPCDDGVFCNGEDSCLGGTCSEHAGDPCDGACGSCDPTIDACRGSGCASDSDCLDDIVGPWSDCESDDPCATDGTQERTVTEFVCDACACVMETTTEMRTCDHTPDPGC